MLRRLYDKRGGRVAVLMLAILVVVIAGIIWLVSGNNSADHSSTPGVPHNQANTSNNGTTSPDPVKSKTGPNGDIHPSPSGTGPGSTNSLLGPR